MSPPTAKTEETRLRTPGRQTDDLEQTGKRLLADNRFFHGLGQGTGDGGPKLALARMKELAASEMLDHLDLWDGFLAESHAADIASSVGGMGVPVAAGLLGLLFGRCRSKVLGDLAKSPTYALGSLMAGYYLVGAATALLGMVLVLAPALYALVSSSLPGSLLALCAAVCRAVYTVAAKVFVERRAAVDARSVSLAAFGIGTAVLASLGMGDRLTLPLAGGNVVAGLVPVFSAGCRVHRVADVGLRSGRLAVVPCPDDGIDADRPGPGHALECGLAWGTALCVRVGRGATRAFGTVGVGVSGVSPGGPTVKAHRSQGSACPLPNRSEGAPATR